MAKVKITKKELPFLKRDLEIDKSVLEKLILAQEKYKARFANHIKVGNEDVNKKYETKIANLKKAKEALVKEFDDEIKKYQTLISGQKTPLPKKPTRKTPVKTPTKKTK